MAAILSESHVARLRAPLTFLNVISVLVFAFNSYISPGNQSFLLPVEPFVASTVVLGILLAHLARKSVCSDSEASA